MKEYLSFKSIARTSIGLAEDRKKIAIFYHSGFEDYGNIAEFAIEDMWDMLKDILSSIEVTDSEIGLQRRKKEANEARTFILRQGGAK